MKLLKQNEDDSVKKSKDVVALWDSTYREYQPLLAQMEEDFQFKLGLQWSEQDAKELKAKKRPILSLNTCRKACDIITGYQRQNFADIRVLPIENTDQERAGIYSEVVKWIMAQRTNKMHVTYAFDDAVTTGLGWITAEVRYDRDIVNGDIVIGNASPFSILPDPLFREPDLSDAKYVLRYSWLSKGEVKSLYPEADASKLKEEEPRADYLQQPIAKGVKKVLVIEKWYRDYVSKTVYVDPLSGNVEDATDPNIQKTIKLMNPEARFITRQIPTIKLITVTKDGSILYDGDHPHGTMNYPFFPVFGYFSPSYNEQEYRIQGMIRILKDPQREKNKRRSQSMYAVMSLPYGGLLVEKGFVDDINAFDVTKGGMKIIEYNPGKQYKQLQAPDLPSALVQLEQMSDQDMRQIGPNPDLLGEQMSRSEPGMNIQMRQKQGMAAIQEFFENLSFAKKTMGNYILELIHENFTDIKISRILGREVAEGFIEAGKDVTFDCLVDEVADSPTTRMATFTTLSNLRQQGSQIPDEILIELIDGISKETKEQLLEPLRLQRQLQVKQMQDQLNPPPPPPPAPMPSPADPMQAQPVDETGMPIQPTQPQEMV